MNLNYTIYDPTRNITLLVTTPVPRSRQPKLAAELMARRPDVEQVGFLEPPTLPRAQIRLQMMGGEFCGNAAMSTAVYLLQRDGLSCETPVALEVSGQEGVLSCKLDKQGDVFWGTVGMPLPDKLGTAELPGLGTVPAVFFPGIVHCIVPSGYMVRAEAEASIRPLCASVRADACGILLFDSALGAFTPLVYVASTDTAVWESGCGSGSAALATHLAAESHKGQTVSLRQPGGIIIASAAWDGTAVTALSITGKVRCLEDGCITI